MALAAVFPAASELVMVYAGALAAGAIGTQHVVVRSRIQARDPVRHPSHAVKSRIGNARLGLNAPSRPPGRPDRACRC